MTARTRATAVAISALIMSTFAHAGERWKSADTDGDGRISRAEAEASSPRFAEHFQKLDKDGDGYVAGDEIQAMREQWHERRSELREQFKKADTDGDGALNL